MGTYYKAVNLDRRESIDPGDHGNWAIKYYGIMSPGHPMGRLLAEAIFRSWSGCRIRFAADEECDSDEPGSYHDTGLKDVTLDVLRQVRTMEPEMKQELWSNEAWAATTPNARQEWRSST